MSGHSVDMDDGVAVGAQELLARAAAAEARAHRGLRVAVEDFFLPEEGRLDERARRALAALLERLIDGIEAEIREHGVRQLSGRGENALAHALATPGPSLVERLGRAGVLRDPALMAELIARVRQELIGAALPMLAPDEPERPSLINRFVQHLDRVLASSAMAVLVAESRRRAMPETGQITQAELPADLHHRLVWWVAAALAERTPAPADAQPLLDRTLCDAAQRSLAAYDEGDRLEAAALRFAAAIDARPQELGELLVESLGDQRIVIFVALLAHALGTGYDAARALVLDPAAERLWLALRGLDLSRETIAQIGYALCEADPRRDLERFADTLDAVMTIPPAEARATLDTIRLHPDYRAALLALRHPERPA
ncbi:MAG: DUF2336 domain-containing protein [Sphingomonas sp.]|uniref:DUF2336 domain-containing protein n=1 Tax=Sphingomonas sp. TaxID=28214 RepID=UPI001B28430B|nr:DUF2336 domain-containing protein [Sphingomonas sp.]MBO9622864.1 DUF2336 domain-containing protein [Sphingomonas sp.]